jgi:hypothetical protein|tara:strand:- start:41 stop:625 length:585 start_codon:yes stop_codon:yes gene_type:complete
MSNSGVFDVNDIRYLMDYQQWSGVGTLELIETKTISSSASAIFTDIQENTYNVHFLTINDFQPTTDGSDLRIRFYENGVEESASVYQYAYQYGTAGGSFGEVKSTGADHIRGTFNTGNSTNEKSHSYVYFYNLGDSSKYSFTTHQGMTISEVPTTYMFFGSGVLPQTSTVDQIKLYRGAGTFDCTASLYGIRYA